MSLVKNQEIDLTIESFGNSGEGVVHVDGYALFVSGARPGERVHVVVTKVKKNYGYARLLSVLDASPDRVEPLCPVYKRCGGCELQHMSYEAQLRFKTERVYDCLTRIGRLSGNSLPGEIPG
ncbi:MAG: TRAM domain-containing protein, partial [Eubacterium sp.]|nr:TRAM domain-containing protein [Eubacterium sp.]